MVRSSKVLRSKVLLVVLIVAGFECGYFMPSSWILNRSVPVAVSLASGPF